MTLARLERLERPERKYAVEFTQGRDYHTDAPCEIGRISFKDRAAREIVVLAYRTPGEPWRVTWVGEIGHAIPVEPGELELGEKLLAALEEDAG